MNSTSAKIAETLWGFSSAGRAPALHAGGQEFESPNLHHKKPNDIDYSVFYLVRLSIYETSNVRRNILKVRTTYKRSLEDFCKKNVSSMKQNP